MVTSRMAAQWDVWITLSVHKYYVYQVNMYWINKLLRQRMKNRMLKTRPKCFVLVGKRKFLVSITRWILFNTRVLWLLRYDIESFSRLIMYPSYSRGNVTMLHNIYFIILFMRMEYWSRSLRTYIHFAHIHRRCAAHCSNSNSNSKLYTSLD